MEVVGALASSLQIVSQCGQVTMTIIKWVESVKTVDDRIDSFINEVKTLRMTYESLSQSLRDPSMMEAARITNRDVGGNLWTQMSRTLQDCEKTMIGITNVLRRIHSSSNLLRPVVKQLRESLNSGELVRLREQVVMFNTSLQLPMQMVTLTLQLRQQEMTTAHQLQLNDQLASLKRGIDRVERMSKGLMSPQRRSSIGGSTIVAIPIADKMCVENMEEYVGTAKKFLDSASVAASTLSAASIKLHDEDSPIVEGARRGSAFVPLTHQQLRSINLYVDELPADSGIGSPMPSEAFSETGLQREVADDSDDDEIELQLIQALLQNGQNEVDKANYTGAEDNYREALSLSESNNFDSRVACSTGDITLMLAECLARQDKENEVITLLQPLVAQDQFQPAAEHLNDNSKSSQAQSKLDKGQVLSANHLLGQVYMKKSDFANAETHAVQAFKGRKRYLGENHPKTIESVLLVIEMYKAKGQNARAEAHRIFLKPVQPVRDARAIDLSPQLSKTPSPTPGEPSLVPIESSPSRHRKPTFSFSSPFKRSEKAENLPTSIPIHQTANLSRPGSTYLIADEANVLSTSPHDTSSLHIGSDIRYSEKQIRKESTNSVVSYGEVQKWTTSSDDVDEYLSGHQRSRNSLSRAPTLYAGLSRSEMEQIFLDVCNLAREGKTTKAVDRGIQFLQKYDPDSAIFVHRSAELGTNIKKSKTKGLAGTGYGFSPLHFFCSLKYEAMTEIDILLHLQADVDAVAYKAGYGKVDPFTPLSLSVDRGHPNVVRLLLQRGASWKPDVMKMGQKFNADRDPIHPLLQACAKGYVAIVESLLEHNAEVPEEIFPRFSWHGNSLLHEACFRCDLDMVGSLLKHARKNDLLCADGYSFVGRPGQQDSFGVTPIMYAVDMRDCTDTKQKARKTRNRIACLKMLLEEDEKKQPQNIEKDETFMADWDSVTPNRVARDLHTADKKGNTVFWYADESRGGDAELKAFLDEQSRKSRLIDF